MAKILLSEQEVSEELGIARQTLANWRSLRQGPGFIKLGKRSVRYSREELLKWLEEHRVGSGERAK
jgi:predicted DNA-binding transcriptional regulator AlpA